MPRSGEAALGATITQRRLHSVLKCKTFDGACFLGKYIHWVICKLINIQIGHFGLYYKYTILCFKRTRKLLIYIRKVVIF